MTAGIVGRRAQLHTLARFLDSARGLIVLAGPPGVGKTALVRAAVTERSHHRWISGGPAMADIPLGALALHVRTFAGGSTELIENAAHDLIETRGSTPAGCIVVDDAHVVDGLSAAVIARAAAMLPVVATTRSLDDLPAAIAAIAAREVIDMQPLSVAEVGAMLDDRLGGTVEQASVHRIHHLTNGLPLYIDHLVRTETDRGHFHRDDGTWWWTGEPDAVGVLGDLISHELARLAPDVAEVADVLAVAGELSAEQLEGIVDATAVEAAVDSGVVAAVPTSHGPRYTLVHPLYGEIGRRRAGYGRRRAISAALIAKIPDRPGVPPPLRISRAIMMLRCGLEVDLAMLQRAAEDAMAANDIRVGKELAGQVARRAVAGSAPYLRASYVLALCATWAGDGVTADDLLRAAMASTSDDADIVRLTTVRAANLAWDLADVDAGAALLDDVGATLHDPDLRALLDGPRAVMLHGRGASLDAVDAARRALNSRLITDPDFAMPANLAITGLLAAGGETGQIVRCRAESSPILERLQDNFDVANLKLPIQMREVAGLLIAGLLDDAAALADANSSVLTGPPGPALIYARLISGWTCTASGRIDTALTVLAQACTGIRRWSETGNPMGLDTLAQTSVAIGHAMQGSAQAASAALDPVADGPPSAYAYYQPQSMLARAWIHAAQGAMATAIDVCTAAADLASRRGQSAVAVLIMQTAVGFGDLDAASRLMAVTVPVDGPRFAAARLHAQGLLADDPSALLTAADAAESYGDLVTAATIAAQAAEIANGQGRRGTMLTARKRASDLQARCESVITPALRALPRLDLPLTRRQWEVAGLLREGLSNAELAERLGMSLRTVEGHVYRINQRLGTTDRAEIIDYLSNVTE